MVDEYCEDLERAGWQVASPIVLINGGEKKSDHQACAGSRYPADGCIKCLEHSFSKTGNP